MNMCLIVMIELQDGMLMVWFFPSGIHEWLSCDQTRVYLIWPLIFDLNYWVLARVQPGVQSPVKLRFYSTVFTNPRLNVHRGGCVKRFQAVRFFLTGAVPIRQRRSNTPTKPVRNGNTKLNSISFHISGKSVVVYTDDGGNCQFVPTALPLAKYYESDSLY